MDSQSAMAALEERAFAARTPLYRLCEKAEVSPAAFTRSRAGKVISVGTLDSLEKAMAAIEAERAA